MSRKNAIGAVKVQFSVDDNTATLLDKIAVLGFLGKNRAEVSAQILRDWLLNHSEKIEKFGISIHDEMQGTSRTTKEPRQP